MPTEPGRTAFTDPPAESPIRVYLLLQNRLLHDALHRVFRKRTDLLVVGSAQPTDCSARSLIEARCEVLACDFFDVRWLPVTLQRESPEFGKIRSLLISMGGSRDEFMAAVRGGVTGYLSKDASTADVVAAVRSTYRGEAICPPKLCAALFEYVSKVEAGSRVRPVTGRPALTVRQQQLVALVAKGLTNREIAIQLGLSEYTVRNHVHRILKHVAARNRSEAVETILSHGYPITA